jgi:hypothetical protein
VVNLFAALLVAATGLAPTQLIVPVDAGLVIVTTTTSAIHSSSHATVTQVRVGSSVHMAVTVSASGTPTGTVEVRLYFNGTCSGTAADVTSATLSGGAVDVTASAYKTVVLGPISFRAKYLGNSSYGASTGACKSVNVIKAVPAISYTIHDASHDTVALEVPLGTDIHPLVKVGGQAATPTGSVTVYLWGSSAFDPPCSVAFTQKTGTLSGGRFDASTVHRSSNTPAVGYVQAIYAGNSLYTSETGRCVKVAWKARASLDATVRSSTGTLISKAKVDTDVYLTAVADGSFGTPKGEVRFKLWNGSTCSGTPAVSRAVQLDTGGEAATRVTVSTVGTKAYQETYEGSDSYLAVTSSCKTFSVVAATASAAPTLPPAATPAASTPTVTPRPTSADGPGATSVPDATSRPVATAAGASTIPPDGTPVSAPSGDPGNPVDPGASNPVDPGASNPGATPAASTLPVASVNESDGATTLVIVALVVLAIGLLLAGIAAGVLLGQRARRN